MLSDNPPYAVHLKSFDPAGVTPIRSPLASLRVIISWTIWLQSSTLCAAARPPFALLTTICIKPADVLADSESLVPYVSSKMRVNCVAQPNPLLLSVAEGLLVRQSGRAVRRVGLAACEWKRTHQRPAACRAEWCHLTRRGRNSAVSGQGYVREYVRDVGAHAPSSFKLCRVAC